MSGLLSSTEIAAMRATANTALPDTATIRRNTPTSDGGGGQTAVWADLTTNVPVRMAPVAGGEVRRNPGERVAQETTHIATLPADTDITEADRIVVSGTTYEAMLVRERAAWELTRRVEVKEAP